MSDVSISATVNTTIEGLQITSGTYTFENVNTSAKTDVSYPTSLIQLADGLYNVTFIGKGTYSQNGTSVEVATLSKPGGFFVLSENSKP